MLVRLLDTVRLHNSSGPIEFSRPQQRCVLAVLAMVPGQTVPVEALVERVWGAQPPRNARTALYSYVSRLRGLLRAADPTGSAALRRHSGGYSLQVDSAQVDLHRARQLVREARAVAATGDLATAADLFAQACDLWPVAQAPLAGLTGDWADRVRAGLGHERLALFTESLETAIRAGRHEAVIGRISEAWAAYPLAESLAGLLMLALYRSGNAAEALEVYRTLRSRVVDQLGDEPGPAMRRMQEQILRRDPDLDLPPPALAMPEPAQVPGSDSPDGRHRLTAPWVPLCQLPPVTPHFVGRSDLVARIAAALCPERDTGAVPVVTVSGPPGIGKSALAVAAAHEVRAAFPDGQWYVRLGSAEPGQVLTELLEAAGMDSGMIPEEIDRRVAALRSRLADRQVLLLLDDAASPAQVRPLLPGTPGAAVLLTSRRRLSGLVEASTTVSVEPLATEAAWELVASLVGAQRLAREPEAAAELCDWCAGHPLALRIVAGRLAANPDWTVRRFTHRLIERRPRLDDMEIDDLAVRPGLDVSYQGLDTGEQAAVRYLAALGNDPVAPWTLGVVTGDNGEKLVESLTGVSLLDSLGTDATGEPRYRLHDLVAAYAGDLAAGHPEQVRAASRRHLDALLAIGDAGYRRLHVDTTDLPAADRPIPEGLPPAEVARLSADPVAWLVAERVPLVAAIERACRYGWHGDAAALADRTLTHVLRVHLGPDGIRRIYEVIRDTARTAGDELVAWRAQARLCTELAISGRVNAAANGLSECAEAFERIGAAAELAFSMGASASYRRYLGGGAELLPQARRALAIARGCGVRPEVDATRQLARLLAGLGRRDEAVTLFDRALHLASTEGLIADQTVTLLGMAGAAYAEGDLDRAESAADRAMELVDGTTDPRGVAYLLLLSARVAASRGQRRDAVETAEDAAAWFADLGDVVGEASAQSLVGRLRMEAGEPERAVSPLEAAAQTFYSVGMHAAHADTLATLADARAAARAG
jgi:DNA-binding SARP family transcriptional activator